MNPKKKNTYQNLPYYLIEPYTAFILTNSWILQQIETAGAMRYLFQASHVNCDAMQARQV